MVWARNSPCNLIPRAGDGYEQTNGGMSYRFRIRETVPAGIRRIALEQIDQALVQLAGSGNDPDRDVRKARTCFKRLRAVLRLVRNEIGTEIYRQENAFYRDAGRRLSAVWHSARTSFGKQEPP